MGDSPDPPRGIASKLADRGVGVGFGIACWVILCQVLGPEPDFALAPPTVWKLFGVAAILAIVAIGLGFTSPWEWSGTIAYLRASKRWANHCCPQCNHAMSPGVFDGPCSECGVPFAPPRPQRNRRAHRLVVLLNALWAALVAAIVWHQLDRMAFEREVAANRSVPHARARWWPASNSGFVFTPGKGISAHD